MITLNRTLVLNTLIKHETLTLTDIAKEENLGMKPNNQHLQFLLEELDESGYVQKLDGATVSTYTITTKGIEEGERLKEENDYLPKG
jgi:predicted transcriptional regulator